MSKCPVQHNQSESTETSAKCPRSRESTVNALNPLNYMPADLSQEMAKSQTAPLSTDRTISAIPKPNSEKWEYPSPQQFYNALVRKGYETPEAAVPTMVQIHNWLNDECWTEIQKWEALMHKECDCISLSKFQGKPTTLSPKAWFYTTFMG